MHRGLRRLVAGVDARLRRGEQPQREDRVAGPGHRQSPSDALATESVALSGLGGLVGTLLGVLATIGYATSQGWPPVVPLVAVAGGCYGALVVGMAAGVYPSVRASRLTPTEARSTT